MFRTIANEYEPESKNIVVLSGGDINSRIGNLIQPPSKFSRYRDNPDKLINSHGKFVAEICNSFKCFPVNNLTYKEKDFDGKFTFYKGDKRSQNDIVIGNKFALSMIDSFKIHEIGYNPSDHFPLVVTCRFSCRVEDFMNKAASDLLTEGFSVSVKRDKKIISDNVDWDAYKQIASHEVNLLLSTISNSSNAPSQCLLDDYVKKISSALYNSARSCFNPPLILNREEQISNIPYIQLLEASNQALSRHLSGSASSQEWHEARLLALKETKKDAI